MPAANQVKTFPCDPQTKSKIKRKYKSRNRNSKKPKTKLWSSC